jgi:glycosyltransferase involved in cell wall biosynthesis
VSLLDHATGQSRPATETLPVTVVVCAYTERRWDQTRAAAASVLGQSPRPMQMILVIDHNPDLAARARRELTGITVLENDGKPGLSGARNTGLAAATQPVTAFLDDDAEARPGWLASLLEPYLDVKVVATGGSVHPRWPKVRPRWLPPTFDWVVGCSYLGLPETPNAIRNPIGANMSVRTELALRAGAFDVSVGRVGRRPRGCEETEMAIRLTASVPGSVVWYVPDAAVDHHVADDRISFRYFVSRCWHEGRSKADVVRLAGATAGLQSERRHTAVVIPRALIRDALALATGDVAALARIGATTSGVAVTASGYAAGRIRPSR